MDPYKRGLVTNGPEICSMNVAICRASQEEISGLGYADLCCPFQKAIVGFLAAELFQSTTECLILLRS